MMDIMLFRRIGTLFMLAALIGCHTSTAPGNLDAPVFGQRHETTFVVDASRAVNVHELAHIAKVIRFYKELTPHEIMVIQAQLKREVDDLVAVEMQSMRPATEQQRRVLEHRLREQLKAVKQDAAATAKLNAAHQAELLRLDREVELTARERVLARLGKDLALPMLTTDNRSVVAFGKMEGEQFQVTTKAYEIDTAAAKLSPGAKVTALNGKPSTVIGQPKLKLRAP